MAHDVFLKIDGIEGSATEGDKRGYIRLVTFSHGIEQPMSGSASGAGSESAGRATHGDFVVLKDIDRATPQLALYCCQGRVIPGVRVEICDSTNLRSTYMEFRMSDVIVRSVRPSLTYASDQDQETIAREQVAFRYGRIQWMFTGHDGQGVPQEEVAHFWDARQNFGG